MAAKPIPDGFRTVTPHLIIQGAAEAMEFYKKAFGAEETARMPGPDGKSVMHGQLKLGDSVLMVAEEQPEMGSQSPARLGGSPVCISLYVEDCDAVAKKAIDAGCTELFPVQDMFWGDRYGQISDPYGHVWEIMTHKEDLTPEEMGKKMAEQFGQG